LCDDGGWLEKQIPTWYAGPRAFRFADVIRHISGQRVVPFAPGSNERDRRLLELLEVAAQDAMAKAGEVGLFVARVNEAGEKMEPFVRQALHGVGIQADTPRTSGGRRANRGYPDIRAIDPWSQTLYLEVKVVTESSVAQTQRSFYLSVPHAVSDCKVTEDARHLLVAFRVAGTTIHDRECLVPAAWEVHDLSSVVLEIKYEFNTCNRHLYGRAAPLAAAGSFAPQLRLPELPHNAAEIEEQ